MGRHFFTLTVVALATALLASACGKTFTSYDNKISTEKGSRILANDGMILVTDISGTAIPNARVMIGMAPDLPFTGNLLTTDASGQVAIPKAWLSPLPVTIEAPGLVRATFFARLPSEAQFSLHRAADGRRINELRGEAMSFPDLSQDGYADVGVVLPTFARADMPNIGLSSVLNSDMDPITVLGQTYQVPANLSIPTQQENYILPITLTKPTFRLQFDLPGTYKVSVVHARFKLSEVANDLQHGTPFTQLINKFTFVEGSTKSVIVKPGLTNTTIPVNANRYTPSINVAAPSYDSRLTMVSMAVANVNDVFMVTDLKRIEPSGSGTLVAPKGASAWVISMLRDTRAAQTGPTPDTFTTTITPASQSQKIEFLDNVAAPALVAKSLVLHPPRELPSVTPVMTRVLLSKVELINGGNYKLEKKSPQWELYANGWSHALELPDFPGGASLPTKSIRWEAAFAGQSGSTNGVLLTPGPSAFEKVTHVTRSAVDF